MACTLDVDTAGNVFCTNVGEDFNKNIDCCIDLSLP